jgi:hypothetical protein
MKQENEVVSGTFHYSAIKSLVLSTAGLFVYKPLSAVPFGGPVFSSDSHSNTDLATKYFDYIIVGARAAIAVVANRLHSKCLVLLFEDVPGLTCNRDRIKNQPLYFKAETEMNPDTNYRLNGSAENRS